MFSTIFESNDSEQLAAINTLTVPASAVMKIMLYSTDMVITLLHTA